MNHPNQPTPLQTLAVRLALRRFHQRYPCPCADHREWKADCERIAWCAVLEADARDTPNMPTAPLDPSVHKTTEALLLDKMGDGHGLVLSEAEQARVDYLARYAENALKRWWRNERRYHSRCVALVEQDEDGEWVEREMEDVLAWEALMGVLERVDCEQVMARLDAVERAIMMGLRDGKAQEAIARELGMSQPAVHKRLQAIRAKARAILEENGGEKG